MGQTIVQEGSARDWNARGERALHERGDLLSARACFSRAYDLARDSGDHEQMAAAAVGEGGLWVHERRAAAEAARVDVHQRLALTELAPASSLALRLRVRRAAEQAYRCGDAAPVLTLVAEARRGADPAALVEALSLAHHCLLGPRHLQTRLALADELLAAATLTDRPGDVLMGLLWRTADLFIAGNLHAQRSYAELAAAEGRQPHAAVGYVLSVMRVMLSIRAGRLAEAERLAQDSLRLGEQAGDQDAPGWHAAHLLAIRWYQGRAAEMREPIAAMATSPTLSMVDNAFVAALAVTAAAGGDERVARGALARICGSDLRALPESSSWLVAMFGVVEAASLLDAPEPAARAYDLLLPHANLPAIASLGVVCFGSVQHALGVASLTKGDSHRAVEHLRAALEQNSALEHWPAMALTKARLGEALAQRGAGGDRGNAETLRAEAAAEARAMDLTLPLATPPGAPSASCPGTAASTRCGRRWRIDVGARSAVVEDSVGLRHLATLLANPGVDIPAVQLAGSDGTTRTATTGGRAGPQVLDAEASRHSAECTSQDVLDTVALRQFRARLRDLRREIDEAEDLGKVERVAQLRSEADWLIDELQAHTGLGGRPRRFADDSERARIAVGKAIRRALQRISAADPLVGEALREAVSTGAVCCYQPAGVLGGDRGEQPGQAPPSRAGPPPALG